MQRQRRFLLAVFLSVGVAGSFAGWQLRFFQAQVVPQTCGDNKCAGWETWQTCPKDCPAPPTGGQKWPDQCAPEYCNGDQAAWAGLTCGNGTCDSNGYAWETAALPPYSSDPQAGLWCGYNGNQNFCISGNGYGFNHFAVCFSDCHCGDGICQRDIGENYANCGYSVYNGDCRFTCGDGYLDSPWEECEDGNTTNGDGCNSRCKREICGNGIVDAGEECDLGPGNGNPNGSLLGGNYCDAGCKVQPVPSSSSSSDEYSSAYSSSTSSSSSSSSSGTCNDNQDNDGDGLKDAESVLSCTDIQTASDLNSVQFKKSNQESSYPNPWPDTASIPAVKNATSGVQVYAPGSIDSVKQGLRQGFNKCYFGSDILSPADDGLPREAKASVSGQGQQSVFTCSPYVSPYDPSQIVSGLITDSDQAYDAQLSEVTGDTNQASIFSRLLGFLFAQVSTSGAGADPYNARVATSQGCYSQCLQTAANANPANPAEHRRILEACQTECVCKGASTYSTFTIKKQVETLQKNKDLLNQDYQKALDCLNTATGIFKGIDCSRLRTLTVEEKADRKRQIDEAHQRDLSNMDNQIKQAGAANRDTVLPLLEQAVKRLQKEQQIATGNDKNIIGVQIANVQAQIALIRGWTDEDLKKKENADRLQQIFDAIKGEQEGCHADCMKTASAQCGNVNDIASQAQCCRAKCVQEMCPFERPPYAPVKTTISTPAPPGGTTGGGGTVAGGGTSRAASSAAASSAGAAASTAASGGATAGTTGGTTAGGPGPSQPLPSYSRSSVAISSTASVAVSGDACYTKYIVPDGLAPDPTKQLGDGQQFAYTGQFAAPWNFQDALNAQKDFNVFLGDVVYQQGSKRFTRGVWSTVSLDGTYSKPVQADVPNIPNDNGFRRSSGLYDGKDTLWNLATQDTADCKKVTVDYSERYLCNFIVQKTSISTNSSKKIVIPNTNWLGARTSDDVWGYQGSGLVASDGSLWFAINAADVLINVRPDMTVKIVPFPSKGCTSVGRPVLQFGDAYCRGASKLKEGPDGSIWFTTGLQAEAEKYPQIGVVKKDGTVKMIYSPSGWEEIVFISSFFKGYDGAMWFTYQRPNSVGVLAPIETKHVGRMTIDGALSFVQTPAPVITMAPGKDGMWFVGNIVKGDNAQPAYQPVIGFLGKTTTKLQTLPADLFRVVGMQSLLVDKDNVPWTRVQNWKNASSVSSMPLAQYVEPVTFLPDTQNVIKFVCGSSSSRSSVSSAASSATQCPANGCALNNNAGDTYCASQGMVCTATDTLPCVKCVPKPGSSSSSSKAPDPRCQQNGCTELGGNESCRALDATCRTSTDFPCYVCDFNAASSRSFSSRSSARSSATSVPVFFLSSSSRVSSAASVAVTSSRASSAPQVAVIVCGNGIVEGTEQCDDGNLSNADACTTQCQLSPYWINASSVPSGYVRSSSPSGAVSSAPAFVALNPARPGFNPLYCGNGQLDTGEECDIGSQNSDLPNASCRSDCLFARCTDGVVDAAKGEQCDDGNAYAGDGCSADCRIEQFAGQPGQVLPGSLVQLPFVPANQNNAVQGYVPTTPSGGPIGNTGPETVAIMAAGASAGYTYLKMKRKARG